MSAELIGILGVGATLLIGLGGLIIGLSLQLHSELRSDLRQSRDETGRQQSELRNELRQFREENSRQHGELAARIDALNTRVDGLNARVGSLSAQPWPDTANATEHVASPCWVA